MKLIFHYPSDIGSLELLLATKDYESIWQDGNIKITERFTYYTGLKFQQEEIDILVHEGKSMSGKSGVPMRLNVHNDTFIKKRNALIHELAHRLLFGNGLYAPDNSDPTDNDEIRVMLFQGDVILDLYGNNDYAYWASTDPLTHPKDHQSNMHYVLSLTKEERSARLNSIITQHLKAY